MFSTPRKDSRSGPEETESASLAFGSFEATMLYIEVAVAGDMGDSGSLWHCMCEWGLPQP